MERKIMAGIEAVNKLARKLAKKIHGKPRKPTYNQAKKIVAKSFTKEERREGRKKLGTITVDGDRKTAWGDAQIEDAMIKKSMEDPIKNRGTPSPAQKRTQMKPTAIDRAWEQSNRQLKKEKARKAALKKSKAAEQEVYKRRGM